ncbi:unnamed protein product [Arctogadus glacialis]
MRLFGTTLMARGQPPATSSAASILHSSQIQNDTSDRLSDSLLVDQLQWERKGGAVAVGCSARKKRRLI